MRQVLRFKTLLASADERTPLLCVDRLHSSLPSYLYSLLKKRLTCRCRKNDPKASPTDILAKSFLLQLIPVARDFTDVGVPERPRNWGDTSNCEYEAHVPAQSWYLDWPQFPVVVRLVQVDRPDSLSWPAPMPGNMVALWGSQTFGVTSRVRLEVISRQLHVSGN